VDDLAALENFVKKEASPTKLSSIKKRFTDPATKVILPEQQQSYRQALFEQLVKTQKITELNLLNLAKYRATTLSQQLIAHNKVSPSQIFIQEPTDKARADDGKVAIEFKLQAR